MVRRGLAVCVALWMGTPASAALVYSYQGITEVLDGALAAGGFGRTPALAPGSYEARLAFETAIVRPYQIEIGVVHGYTEYINGQAVGGHNSERRLAFVQTLPSQFDASFVINAPYLETRVFPEFTFVTSHHLDYLSARYFEGVGSEPVRYTFTISTAAAVPETATWALMIGGFGLAGAAVRRRSVMPMVIRG